MSSAHSAGVTGVATQPHPPFSFGCWDQTWDLKLFQWALTGWTISPSLQSQTHLLSCKNHLMVLTFSVSTFYFQSLLLAGTAVSGLVWQFRNSHMCAFCCWCYVLSVLFETVDNVAPTSLRLAIFLLQFPSTFTLSSNVSPSRGMKGPVQRSPPFPLVTPPTTPSLS